MLLLLLSREYDFCEYINAYKQEYIYIYTFNHVIAIFDAQFAYYNS